jgi:predicted ATPase
MEAAFVPAEPSVVLRGRDHEAEALSEILTRARAGRGGALAIVAPSGMGKSALLETAVRSAAVDFVTLGTRGIRREENLPFAGLHRLLWPLSDRIRQLPPRQADALAPVLGDGDGGTADAFVVCSAVHHLLAEAARNGPVLCWADDAHRLDRVSLEALTFAARRLATEPVVMLFAARNDCTADPEQDGLTDVPRLRLPALDETASRQVLEDQVTRGLTADLAGS